MKRTDNPLFVFGILAAFVLPGMLAPPAFAFDWQEIKGDHFIVYYGGDQVFARDALRKAEVYYNRIADDLGYARHSNFWQWENRARIMIYPTEKQFQEASGEPAWSKGTADYSQKQILTFAWSGDFLESLLPHEIAHLVFRDFVGFKGEVPLWLDEGVAQYEEPKKRALARRYGSLLLQKQKMLPFVDMGSVHLSEWQEEETVQFFYMQSLSVVEFLLKRHGAISFAGFCRELRDGKSLDEALLVSYPGRIGGLEDLQSQWIKYVMEET